MVNSPVLVLNQNFEPLNISRARRAVVLLMSGKAETLENDSGMIHTASNSIPIPSVIRLVYMVKRPRPEKKLTRREVFRRDRGGRHIWENVVSACLKCNNRKAGRTPQEAGMTIAQQPFAPYTGSYYVSYEYIQRHNGWQKFLPLQQISDWD